MARHWFLWIAGGVCGAVVFALYSYFYWTAPAKFVSPDETANYVFAKEFSRTLLPAIPAPLNDEFGVDFFHPRSTIVRALGDGGAYLVPASFLGLVLIVGMLAKLVGITYAALLTPLLSVVSVCFFYGIIKRIFDKKVALLSSFFLFIHPAFWYFAARPFLHNSLFISLFIIASYCCVRLCDVPNNSLKKSLWAVAAGLGMGLALAVRASEVVWIAPALLLLLIVCRRRLPIAHVVIFGCSVLVALLPVFYFNHVLYGSVFSFSAYTSDIVTNSDYGPVVTSWWQRSTAVLFPFGVHIATAMNNFWRFGLLQFNWFSFSALFGLALVIVRLVRKKGVSRHLLLYLVIGGFVAFYLILYYGSWTFSDHPNPYAVTIGTSYVRYWLPIFVFCTPFVAYFYVFLYAELRKQLRAFTNIVFLSFGAIIFIFSVNIVFNDPYDGLMQLRTVAASYVEKAAVVQRVTEENAVIISGKADKIVFPERTVILDIGQERVAEKIAAIVQSHPVYFFTLSSQKKLGEINDTILKPNGVAFGAATRLSDQETFLEIKRYDDK